MTVRKQVDEPTRIAIAKEISALLDARDESGKKRTTQAELGKRIGVSQEAVRRARDPDGVTPAIVTGWQRLETTHSPELLSDWRASYKEMTAVVARRFGLRDEEGNLEDEAAAVLIRRGVGLREAERAVRAVREFMRGDLLTAEAWADIAHSLVIAHEKQKQVGAVPQQPHSKDPPRVARTTSSIPPTQRKAFRAEAGKLGKGETKPAGKRKGAGE